jgi:hypothetical protein
MSKLQLNLKQFRLPVWAEPLIIFLVCFFAYGVVIPWLGYYWDDWAFLFIRTQLGAEGLTRYFSTNRPFIAWIPQLTISLLGTTPWKWHVLMLFMRAASAICVWWVIRLVWHKTKDMALWVALLFAVYPGFDQQAIAINYTDFFLLFIFLMLSFSFSILALRDKKHVWLYFLVAIPLTACNHLALEYFFLLEFLRPVFMWFSLKDEYLKNSRKHKRVLLYWLPFLLVWLGALIWRFFIFDYQTNNYEIGLLDQLKAAPWETLSALIMTVIKDIFQVTLGAWALPFSFPVLDEFGLRSTLLFAAVILATLGITLAGVFWQKRNESDGKTRNAITFILVGLWGMIIAGWPFWLTHLEIGLHFATSRFTLPFILGASLFLVGLVKALPIRTAVSSAILAALIALAAGYQIQVAMDFRRDWNTQKNLFWQLAWRAPGIEPDTIIVSNDTPIRFSSDNSLVSPLNWMYAPDNHSDKLEYMFFYPSIRLETALKNLEPGMTIKKDYLAATFTGSTDQMIAMVYSPPGCVRMLDPELDPVNQMLPLLIRQAAALSRVDLIQEVPAGVPAMPMSQIFSTEPPHGWCYYFEKADLARQQGDWVQVARLGDEAFAQGDYPNDPAERLVFIEGYAHTAQWEKSINLTNEANAITPLMKPVLCKLWQRIERDMGSDTIRGDILPALQRDLNCTP